MKFLIELVILEVEELLEVVGLLADNQLPFSNRQTISSTVFSRMLVNWTVG